MKARAIQWIPALIAGVVGILVATLQALPLVFPQFNFFQRLEWMSYDWRVRKASIAAPRATNLAIVVMSDDSIEAISDGSLGLRFGLYWPRSLYGKLVRELSFEGAKAVGFDVMFKEMRYDHPPVRLPDNSRTGSDSFFAHEMRRATNVILGAEEEAVPVDLFRTNALAIGDISAKPDADGILRQARAYVDYRIWHPAIRRAVHLNGLNMSEVQLVSTGLVAWPKSGRRVDIPIVFEPDHFFDLKRFSTDVLKEDLGEVTPPRDKAFTDVRVWTMGIVLAAQELGLDLAHAVVRADGIVLPGKAGLERTIPTDAHGRFFVDWALRFDDDRLQKDQFERLLTVDMMRQAGQTVSDPPKFKDKLVMVGSTATGADLTDRVTTPLEKATIGMSQHWNVANSLITGRFVKRSSYATELGLVILMCVAAAVLTWELRAAWAAVWVVALALLYGAAALGLFIQFRYWLPMVLPLVGSLLATHVCLVSYRVVFEQRERRRIKSVFVKVVSPEVVNELLQSERLSLGGARRNVTIFFADVRGFTEMTDVNHAQAEKYVRDRQLTGPTAESYFDQQAQEVLQTVNLYLSAVADVIKKHHGTLDKYIGDCVMAFWGAPVPNARHATECVRAAVEAQRAIYALNQQRFADNKRREANNPGRMAAGEPALPMLSLLSLGTGINTGMVTVGLMGSDAHILNYTVFGREVNLASRLEGVSGRGRILISETTFNAIRNDDAELASTCVGLAPVVVKGIHEAVKIYEVPWKAAAKPAGDGNKPTAPIGTAPVAAAVAPHPRPSAEGR